MAQNSERFSNISILLIRNHRKCKYYVLKADNTFLLALDGDVDFTPGSVRILIDRMKKDQRVGAACGRIHPIGSGINCPHYEYR